jgi:hypothetical protein
MPRFDCCSERYRASVPCANSTSAAIGFAMHAAKRDALARRMDYARQARACRGKRRHGASVDGVIWLEKRRRRRSCTRARLIASGSRRPRVHCCCCRVHRSRTNHPHLSSPVREPAQKIPRNQKLKNCVVPRRGIPTWAKALYTLGFLTATQKSTQVPTQPRWCCQGAV